MAKSFDFKEYARRGAHHRLGEIRDEIVRILRQFPDLKAPRKSPGSPFPPNELAALGGSESATPRRRKKRKMTAAQRKAVGERMKKYWAERKKAEKR